ncbi:DUF3341 domain-containing protein [Silvanigrella paludirubra]|jgi:hypothetical protein|uniref:DUF3341 domain-containing protein n=1 Tax=Silvanigrella paludirubra TaxID=2499159 RepID=A0A6N6VRL8_9BACT|nr:DUF3341 domain-containing protein [Silvanigrella paludirubra]KAB8038752.1 DUF3341 domain-containing protein [Silvanigrella paludirubra]
MTTNDKKMLYGILAQFETAPEIYHACEKVRDRGFSKWDAHSPFPVHGLDKAMGLPQSKLSWIVGATSAICGIGGFATWVWMNGVDYKLVIAGKPFLGLTGYFLPGFECAVLSAAIACLFGMLALNKLPRWYHSLFRSEAFKRATDDKFFISIEATDPKFHPVKTMEFLKELGASNVELVEQ